MPSGGAEAAWIPERGVTTSPQAGGEGAGPRAPPLLETPDQHLDS